MTEPDLEALLAAIDTPADAPADAEERVWQTLRAELFAETESTALFPPRPEDTETPFVGDATGLVVRLEPARGSARRRWVVAALAAAAVVVLAGLAIVLLEREPKDLRVTDDPTPTEPAPANRPEACLRYRLESPLFDELEAAITADPSTAPELVDDTRAGLDQLRADLDGLGLIGTDLSADIFLTLDGALNQARLSLLAGDIDSTRQALDFAQGTYRESGLAADSCLG